MLLAWRYGSDRFYIPAPIFNGLQLEKVPGCSRLNETMEYNNIYPSNTPVVACGIRSSSVSNGDRFEYNNTVDMCVWYLLFLWTSKVLLKFMKCSM